VEFQDYYDFIVSLATAETIGTPLVPAGTDIGAKIGCPSPTTAACLRAVPAAKLVRIQPPALYPIVDGTILAQAPAAAFASGQFNQVPIISGGAHDEYRFFVAAQYDAVGHPLVTLTDYENATIALFGPSLESSVLSVYPSDSPSPGVALGRSGTDGLFACPEHLVKRTLEPFRPLL
jgi:para-nitrobenzyl esterase